MVVMDPGAFFQNKTNHKAVTHRLAQSALMPGDDAALMGGVGGMQFRPLSWKVLPQASPNMSVRLSRGLGLVRGAESASQGTYTVANDAEIASVAINASHATLARIDMIGIKASDAIYSGALNQNDYFYVPGIPATPGTEGTNNGALPTNFELLALILVGPGVSSITTSNILDWRRFYVAQGGVKPIRNHESGSPGIDYGHLRYWNGRIEGWNAEATTGWRPLGVDNVQYTTTGFTYLLNQAASFTVLTVNIPDPGYPYFIEGEMCAHCLNNAGSTRWDMVGRLDTAGGTVMTTGGMCVGANGESIAVQTNRFRHPTALTGAHSVVCRYEKVFGGNSSFNSEAAVYIRVVPQPPAANAGVLINV